MKDLIKEVALEVADKLGWSLDSIEQEDMQKYLSECLAELSKRAEVSSYLFNGRDELLFPEEVEQGTFKEQPELYQPLFTFQPIHDIEAIENRTAEACAKLFDQYPFKRFEGYQIVSEIRSGEWRKYK